MANRNVYIVRSSSDGNEGVYGSHKKALEICKNILGDDVTIEKLSKWTTCVYGKDGQCDIEQFSLVTK